MGGLLLWIYGCPILDLQKIIAHYCALSVCLFSSRLYLQIKSENNQLEMNRTLDVPRVADRSRAARNILQSGVSFKKTCDRWLILVAKNVFFPDLPHPERDKWGYGLLASCIQPASTMHLRWIRKSSSECPGSSCLMIIHWGALGLQCDWPSPCHTFSSEKLM